MSVDLSTKYLGLELKNPVVVAACSLSEKLADMRLLEDAGAAAIVLFSLFEEQIQHDEVEAQAVYEHGADSFAEALSYFPEMEDYRSGPDSYLEHIEEAKKALSIPVIGSINGTSQGGWIRYAKLMEEAGADAVELNIYFVAADISMTSAEVEAKYTDLVAAVKESVSIPLAVKIGSHFSSVGHMAARLTDAGADGLVLFNRFLQPDIDLEEMQVLPKLVSSTEYDLLLPMRWIAILNGKINASMALSGGIHTAEEMLKGLAVGADVGMIASVLYQQGFGQIGQILAQMQEWMEEKEYTSVAQLKGSMSQAKCPDPAAFERGNYMKALTSFSGKFI